MNKSSILLALGSALVLSACGGGGGGGSTGGGGTGGGNPPPPVQTSPYTVITAANANKVGATTYAASASISDSSYSLTDILTGVSVGKASKSLVAPVLGMIRHVGGAPQLLTGVVISNNCTGGGSVSIDATLANSQTISNGDTMKMTATNCVEDGSTMNGALSITFSNVTGDVLNGTTYKATMDSRFTAFSLASGTDTAILNGDMKMAVDQTSATSNTLTISGTSLQLTEQRAGTTIGTSTLGNYTMTGSTNGTTVTSAANFTLSGNSTALGNYAYIVKNVQPFVATGLSMPGSGSMLVTGDASSVTVTAVDSNNVRVDYSAKGDGVITQTNTFTWLNFLTL
jgi:hypothetical protein